MKHTVIIATAMMMLTFGMVSTAKAGILEELQLRARAGYSIGLAEQLLKHCR